MQDKDKKKALEKIYSLISKVALREELELRSVGTGMFSMQEEAFVYMVGKEIANHAIDVFDTENIRWYTEKKIDDKSGITDLVFENNEGMPVLAMEFKTRRDKEKCKDDIKKLRSIKRKCMKVFCALVDACSEKDIKDNELIKAVEAPEDVDRLCKNEFFDYFSTIGYRTDSSRSFRQTCCIVAAWEVTNNESGNGNG